MHILVQLRPSIQFRINIGKEVGRDDGRDERLNGLVEEDREDDLVDMVWKGLER
jgi:hypothetical protein